MPSCGGILIADDYEDPDGRDRADASTPRPALARRHPLVAGLDGAPLSDVPRARLHGRLHESFGEQESPVDSN